VPSQAPPPTSHPHQPARMPPYTPSPAMHGYYQPMPANPSNPPTNADFYNPSMGYTPPYPAYYGAPGSSSSYQAGYQMGKPAAQYPPAQGNPPQQASFSGQGYVNPQAGYNPQGQAYSAQQGQGQYTAPSGQGYSNPNYQYYIGNNPPK
jgi:hypothetical protein